MVEELQRAIRDLRAVLADLAPERFDGPRSRELVAAFGEVERLGAAGKALAVRQVVATGSWKKAGSYRDAADWLAATTGTTVGAARATVDTATRLDGLPSTEAALRAGTLSSSQADAITDAASADPHAEADLLERAQHDGVRGLRNACARVKAAASIDQDADYERIRTGRSLRHWTDADGTGRIDIRGPVDLTARFVARLAPHERTQFDAARKAGRHERSDTLAFDALIAWADTDVTGADGSTSDTSRSGPHTTALLRIDHAALVRGDTEPGEICELADGGPIPVSVASRLLDDAIIKAVVMDGTDVRAVSHLGRTIPARLRTALEELYPECGRDGCHVTHGLEIDHNQPIEEGGPTALWNLQRLCSYDHWYKHNHHLRLEGEGTNKRFFPAPPREPGRTGSRDAGARRPEARGPQRKRRMETLATSPTQAKVVMSDDPP